MGSSSCGLLIKKEIAEEELEAVFGKKLIKAKDGSYEDCLHSVIDGDYIAVVKGARGTGIFHDMYLLGEYTTAFIEKLQTFGGCGFAMSSTSMAADFVHYLPDGIQEDSYLYEEEFTQEGPNILGITENMEMLFEEVDELIGEYIGGYETWSDAAIYELGDPIPQEMDKDLKDTAEKFGLTEKSSGDLLEIAVLGISLSVNVKKDLGKFAKMMKVQAGLSLTILESRGAKLSGLHPKDSSEYHEIKNKFKDLTLSELRSTRIAEQQSILSGKPYNNSVSRYFIVKKVIEERISYLRKQKRLEDRAKGIAETLDDKSTEEITFMYLFSCSSIELEKINSTQTNLIKKAVEIQFEKRQFKYLKSVNEKETYQYFNTFFNSITNQNLQVQDYSFSTLGKTKQLVLGYENYPAIKALKAQYVARGLKPSENSIMHHLLYNHLANKDKNIPSSESGDIHIESWKVIAALIIVIIIIAIVVAMV